MVLNVMLNNTYQFILYNVNSLFPPSDDVVEAFTAPTSPDVPATERPNGEYVEPYVHLTRNEKKVLIAQTCESVVVDPEG